MPQDYYERLGIDRDASESEIKTAFRQRIKETHPDVSDDEAASDRTKRLIEAKDVLIDPTERQRYDRLGHEAYVNDRDSSGVTEQTDSEEHAQAGTDSGEDRRDSGQRGSPNASARTESSTAGGQQSDPWSQTEGNQQSRSSGGPDERYSRQAGQARDHATNWYDSTRRQRSTPSDGRYRAWDTDQSYAVGDSPGMFSPRELLTSQRTIVLLGTTFVIYPVLLFGALFRPFPTAVNLTVAMCIVLVIAFMQSVPQVGILVFGIWTVLLPIILFGVVGVSVLSVQGVLSLAAVTFPLGLSVLTWIAIGPMKR
ncbi:J domain-containing protein [Halovenus sp. HT40]|uniref:J domain-containing protein n=1 Tax=Halovenus sp. HT40 TaxID=3126691 RepID=UPI00300EF2D0